MDSCLFGWYGNSKGYVIMTNFHNMFKTKEDMQGVLDNLHNLPDAEDYFDEMFFNLYEISENELTYVPYWIEEYCGNDNIRVEYIEGYYEPRNYGDTIKLEGRTWRYIDSQSLPEEIEHQTDDGGLVYEYRGYSFLRILELVE